MTPRQSRFVDEFLIDLNAHQAAVRAGYSIATARQMGPETLSNPAVAEAIASRIAERAERRKIDADRVLPELARIATADIRNVALGTRHLRAG